MAMDARKQRILEAIVALYSTDGEPVGSGLLASYFDMAVSTLAPGQWRELTPGEVSALRG